MSHLNWESKLLIKTVNNAFGEEKAVSRKTTRKQKKINLKQKYLVSSGKSRLPGN